jgi:hypothetical protein
MDASQSFPITIVQGATYILPINYYQPDGSVVNLSGYSADMIFRATVQDTGSPIIEVSTSLGTIIINGVNGIITLTIPSTVTALLQDGQQMYYNLFITSPTGIVTPLLAGPAYVEGSTIR